MRGGAQATEGGDASERRSGSSSGRVTTSLPSGPYARRRSRSGLEAQDTREEELTGQAAHEEELERRRTSSGGRRGGARTGVRGGALAGAEDELGPAREEELRRGHWRGGV